LVILTEKAILLNGFCDYGMLLYVLIMGRANKHVGPSHLTIFLVSKFLAENSE